MKTNSENNNISSEVLAAFLDGNATAAESQAIFDELAYDPELRELMDVSHSVDEELGLIEEDIDYIPMTALAATCDENNYCCLECEKYILNKRDIEYNESELLDKAIKNKWQKQQGTALHNIGRHLEDAGLIVTRTFKCTIDDIAQALNATDDVIVAVDGGELTGNKAYEISEDILIGPIPDHTVVVLSIDQANNTITIHDPNSPHAEDTYPIAQFIDAWNDSKNYLVAINSKEMKEYIPQPIDLSDVELTDDLNELREAIAKNAHDVWAKERMAQGWTYGPQRNDEKKETPCMVEYSQLPDSEKKFDREMAMNTIKLLKKLGYDLVKRK